MSYNFHTQYNSPNYGQIYGPIALPCRRLTIHHWDDPARNPQPMSVINGLCNPNRGASAHAVVWPGNVACIVDYDKAAWHAGNATGNQSSIGLELDPCHVDATIETVAEYIADLIRQGVLARDFEIYGHKDWSSTACPGAYYGRLAEIKAKALARVDGKPAPAIKPSSSSSNLDQLADDVLTGKYGNGDERRRRLGASYDAVQARVNQMLSVKSSAPNIDQLADDVINGKYGNGDERRRRLGASYDAVQARVNQKLGVR
ncbi:N-acetylmuramoyl-L-alanine amidase [Propionimicrobium lymphophilum]|uniref:N-acetylmuramoyl-L-alanine amidase n=1 Tax=Propionimicrobium lymphophilum TaxID=33012 RepID=UPI0023F32450|nr:N-acetylmuramoyl-L-alanine amidase [Propionimicrobium lymphophilum]